MFYQQVDDKMLLRITALQNNLYFARVRLLRHTLPFFFTDFEKKKVDCFAV